MPKLTGLTAVTQTDGSLELIASSPAGAAGPTMWHQWQIAPGDEWIGWQPFGEPGSGDPGPLTTLNRGKDGQVELFVVGGDRAVWHRRQTGSQQPDTGVQPGPWSDWESLGQPDGNPVQGPLSTATSGFGQDMAVVVAGGAVWQSVVPAPAPGAPSMGPDPRWSAWSPLYRPVAAGTIESTVLAAVIMTGSSDTALIALVEWPDDPDIGFTYDRSTLWHRRTVSSAPDDWSDWEPLPMPDQGSVPVGLPFLAQNFAGDPIVFTRTSDGALWQTIRQATDPLSWAPWELVVRPGYGFGDLTAIADEDGLLLVATPTATGNHLWYSKQQSGDGTAWSPLSPLVTVPDASAQDTGALTCPALVADHANRVWLFSLIPATGNVSAFTQFDLGELPVLPVGPFRHPD